MNRVISHMVLYRQQTNCLAIYTRHTRTFRMRYGEFTCPAKRHMNSAVSKSCKKENHQVLIRINYPGSGNYSQMFYDGLGRNTKIEEFLAAVSTETKQFVWCSNYRCEERAPSGTLSRQFYSNGEKISSTTLFHTRDHLGSVREMTDQTGAVQSQYSYDSFGRIISLKDTIASDFLYARYYRHERSDLSLTLYRAYCAKIGRWLSRDPIPTDSNGYMYVLNDPIATIDSLGLKPDANSGLQFQRALPKLMRLCECCYKSDIDKKNCKLEAINLTNTLSNIWQNNFSSNWSDNFPNGSIGGYYCNDWSWIFYNNLSSSNHFVPYLQAQGLGGKPTWIHQYVLISMPNTDPTAKCKFYIDNGWPGTLNLGGEPNSLIHFNPPSITGFQAIPIQGRTNQ